MSTGIVDSMYAAVGSYVPVTYRLFLSTFLLYYTTHNLLVYSSYSDHDLYRQLTKLPTVLAPLISLSSTGKHSQNLDLLRKVRVPPHILALHFRDYSQLSGCFCI